MRQKSLIALLAAAFVAAVLAVFSGLGGGPNSNPQIGRPVLTDLTPHLADIEQVALMHGDSKTTLARHGDRWVVAERGDYPADAKKLRPLLLGLAALAYVEPKTKEARNYPKLQVEDAGAKDSKSTLVTVSGARGTLLGEIIAGKRVTDALGGGDDGVYVRKPGDAQSWLARGTLDLSDTPGWLDPALLDLPAAGVKEMLLTSPDGATLAIARGKPEDKFHLVALPKDKKLRSDDALDAVAGALAGLQLSDVKNASDFAWPKTGASRARFTFFDGLVVTVELVDLDKTGWARITAAGSGDASARARELNARTAPWVYALPAFKANLLKTRLADLLAPAKPS
ncbi:MAG TPA: DUF4340 domain-containing protein [Stellaceae bacterium]|nr:DUF4340 domain-containing protein [Stellaceae bacterium]